MQLLAVVVLVLASGLFVAVEFALVAVDRPGVEHRAEAGDRRAARVLRLLRRLSFHLSGAQLGITATSLTLGFLAEPAVARLVSPAIGDTPAVVTALVLATVLQMIVGELVPRGIAVARPDRTARATAAFAAAYGRVFGPLIRLLTGAANAAVRRLGIEPAEALTAVRSLEELEFLIRSSGEEGTLAPESYSVLRRALRFAHKTAADALVPRVDVEAVAADATVDDLVARSVETGRSRFPVIGAGLDDIVGVVHVKDVYRLQYEQRASTTVADIAADAWFVPETADLADLLDGFRRLGTHLAVVVDEYGGTAGILSLEDVLEELVGEIDDEHDVPPAPSLARVLPGGTHELTGTLHPDEVEDACGFVVPDGPYETLAGFVLDRLGRIPEPGDVVDHDGWRLEVVEMDRLRVAGVRLTAPARAREAPV